MATFIKQNQAVQEVSIDKQTREKLCKTYERAVMSENFALDCTKGLLWAPNGPDNLIDDILVKGYLVSVVYS